MGRLLVMSVCNPGPNRSAAFPSLTKSAICDSRTVSLPPLWISMSFIGNRYINTPGPDSVHWMTSMNCFRRKSPSPMVRLLNAAWIAPQLVARTRPTPTGAGRALVDVLC